MEGVGIGVIEDDVDGREGAAYRHLEGARVVGTPPWVAGVALRGRAA